MPETFTRMPDPVFTKPSDTSIGFAHHSRWPKAAIAIPVAMAPVAMAFVGSTTDVKSANPTAFVANETGAKAPSAAYKKLGLTTASSQTNSVVRSIRKLALLEDNWHSPQSKAPTAKSIEDAERFAREIDWKSSLQPMVSAAEDGEVNFYWKNESIYIDLGFHGDGTYSFFAKLDNGETLVGDDIPARAGSATLQIKNLIKTA